MVHIFCSCCCVTALISISSSNSTSSTHIVWSSIASRNGLLMGCISSGGGWLIYISCSSNSASSTDIVWSCSSNIWSLDWMSCCGVISWRNLSWGNLSSIDIASLDILSSLSSNILFSFWVVNDLSLNGEILNSFPDFFNWFVFNNSFFNFFGNIFNLSFYSIVISDSSFNGDSFIVNNFIIFNNFPFKGNSFNPFNFVIFNVFLFERNVLNSAFNGNFFRNYFLSKICSNLVSSRSTWNILGVSSWNILGISSGDILSVSSRDVLSCGSTIVSSTDIACSNGLSSRNICACCNRLVNNTSLSGSIFRGRSIAYRSGIVCIALVWNKRNVYIVGWTFEFRYVKYCWVVNKIYFI